MRALPRSTRSTWWGGSAVRAELPSAAQCVLGDRSVERTELGALGQDRLREQRQLGHSGCDVHLVAPGMTELSLLPQAVLAEGTELGPLYRAIAENALRG